MRRFLPCLLALLVLLSLACSHRSAGPSFTLAVEPAQIRLLPGLSQTVTLTLKPDPGFSGRVELSAPGLGAGVEASFTPATLTLADGVAAQVSVLLSAKEDSAPGRRSIGFQAAAEGRTEQIELVADIPVAAFFTVLTYRGVDPANFAYLAYQDGDGPWTSVPGQNGLYRLPLTDPSGRFGVFLGDVCQGNGASTWISNGFFSTHGEVQTLQALVFCNPQPGPPAITFDLNGALAGAPGRSILISANSGLWSFPPGATDYSLKLNKGNGDLLAAAYPSTQDYIPSRIIVERGRDAQAPATRDFDFAAQGGDTPAPLPIQRPALGADEEFQGTVQYQTSRGQVAILGYGRDLSGYAPFPPAAAQAGDGYGYAFQVTGPSHSRSLQGSGSQPPGPLAPRLPSAIPPFTLAGTGAPGLRLSLGWDAVTPAPNVHEAVVTQTIQGKQAYCYLYFGRSWHGGVPRMTWTMPDFSSVPGFNPGFLPQAGTAVRVSIYQSGSQAGPAPASTLPAGNPFSFVAPPSRSPLAAGRPEIPGLRLQPIGPAASKAASSPWLEFWSASRTQTLNP